MSTEGYCPSVKRARAEILGDAAASDASSSKIHEKASEVVKKLLVYVPSGTPQQEMCSGQYEMIPGELRHGMHVWKNVGEERWLYSGKDGFFYIGDAEEKHREFNTSMGYIRSSCRHNGKWPHAVEGSWMKFNDKLDNWHPDSSITVITTSRSIPKVSASLLVGKFAGRKGKAKNQLKCKENTNITPMKVERSKERCTADDMGCSPSAAPRQLHIFVPSGTKEQQMCSGEYEIVLGEEWAGRHIWKNAAGNRWLYSSDDGFYYIGDEEEKLRGFCTNMGYIRSSCCHNSRWPQALDGSWHLFNDKIDNWVADHGITVLACSRSAQKANNKPRVIQGIHSRTEGPRANSIRPC